VFNTKGWTQPENLAEQFIKESLVCIEPYEEERALYDIFGREKAHITRFIREAESLARIVSYMKRVLNWRVCFLHYHILNAVNHRYAVAYEGLNGSTHEEVEVAQEAVRRAYQIIDSFVGDLVKHCTSDETIIALVSDHGAVPA